MLRDSTGRGNREDGNVSPSEGLKPNAPRPTLFVWCAEDEKYGLQAVYATKKAADKDYGPNGVKRWPSGFGGSVIRRKVIDGIAVTYLLHALEAAAALIEVEYGPYETEKGYWPTIRPIQKQILAAIAKARGERSATSAQADNNGGSAR